MKSTVLMLSLAIVATFFNTLSPIICTKLLFINLKSSMSNMQIASFKFLSFCYLNLFLGYQAPKKKKDFLNPTNSLAPNESVAYVVVNFDKN